MIHARFDRESILYLADYKLFRSIVPAHYPLRLLCFLATGRFATARTRFQRTGSSLEESQGAPGDLCRFVSVIPDVFSFLSQLLYGSLEPSSLSPKRQSDLG